MEDKKTKRSDKRWKTATENGKRFTKLGEKCVSYKRQRFFHAQRKKRSRKDSRGQGML